MVANRATRRAVVKADQAGRKMPINDRTVELDGAYVGWWIKVRTNPPLGEWLDGLVLAQSGNTKDMIKGMHMVLESTLLDWNYVDEKGELLPVDLTGIRHCPLELLTFTFEKINTEVSDAPLGTPSD